MLEFFQLVIIPIIIGIVEVVKRAGLPVKFSPLVSVTLGVIFGILYVQPLLDGIVIGLMVGLSATGLYSGGKNVFTTSGKQPGKK
jgi:L-cystine uptake protein TcyP (sodium:dicarboxylate symporter family)